MSLTNVEVDMRFVRGLISATMLAVAVVGTTAAPSAATSCSGPELSASPTTIAPGTRMLLSGWGFGTDCTGSGLGDPASVEIVVRVGEQEKAVGRIQVGPDYDFVIPLHIPPSLGTGTGAILARYDDPGRPPVQVSIEVAGSEGDHGDQPYFEIDASGSGDGIPWGWIAGGAIVGAALALGLVAIVGRKPA